MDDWFAICGRLSDLFEANKDKNFGITLTPIQVAEYLVSKVMYVRLNTTIDKIPGAAFFVTNDGECGFVASNDLQFSDYKYLINEFKSFVVSFPEEYRNKLWCRIQPDNTIVQKLVERLGFRKDKETDSAIYYLYGG